MAFPSEVVVAVRAVPDVDETTLLTRYQNGDHEAVWRDSMALGASVREVAGRAHQVADVLNEQNLERLHRPALQAALHCFTSGFGSPRSQACGHS